MNAQFFFWLTVVIILTALPDSRAQNPVTNQDDPCFICPALNRALPNNVFFHSPCPNVLPSFSRGGMSYAALTNMSKPERSGMPLSGVYFEYLCKSRKMHRMADEHYEKVRSGINKRIAPTDVSIREMRSLVLRRNYYKPYDRFASDIKQLEDDDNGWNVLGLIAVDLIRDIWIRN